MKILKIHSKKFGVHDVYIDDCDFCLISKYRWSLKKDYNAFYAKKNFWIMENGVKKCIQILMHRIILGITDSKIIIDHIDHNGLNNQRHNLRICTYSQNACNRNPYRNTSSKYKGVTFYKKTGKWRSVIRYNKKTYSIGSFDTEIEAAIAYNKKAIVMFGNFAGLNIIE